MKRHYHIKPDYTALKTMIASAVFCWVILNLDWSQWIVKADWADPRSDVKVVEIEKVEYVIPKTVKDEICAVFGEDCNDAIKVFTCESGLRPNAKGVNRNGSTDVGIAQINSVHSIPEKYLKNQHINIQVAHQIFSEQGWRPWVCARKLGIK